jgi:hypothetical protein
VRNLDASLDSESHHSLSRVQIAVSYSIHTLFAYFNNNYMLRYTMCISFQRPTKAGTIRLHIQRRKNSIRIQLETLKGFINNIAADIRLRNIFALELRVDHYFDYLRQGKRSLAERTEAMSFNSKLGHTSSACRLKSMWDIAVDHRYSMNRAPGNRLQRRLQSGSIDRWRELYKGGT